MRVECKDYVLRLTVPFAISRGTADTRRICIARLEHDGITGYGEASPSAYYGDSPAKAGAAILGAGDILKGDFPVGGGRPAIKDLSQRLSLRFPESPSGRAAVETAFLDLAGKIEGRPVHALLGLPAGPLPMTSFTVGVTDAGIARGMLESLRNFPILKAKVGFGDEEALLELLSAETDAIIRVDANEGWTFEDAVVKIDRYREHYSIELFEQPLPREDVDGYRRLRQATDATIILDESVVTVDDIAGWEGIVDGVNTKLMKCGGLLGALRIADAARARGMKIMLGCMVESSLGITAAAQIASVADYCDLDGNLLVSNDPFSGVKALDGMLRLPEAEGLGATPVAGL